MEVPAHSPIHGMRIVEQKSENEPSVAADEQAVDCSSVSTRLTALANELTGPRASAALLTLATAACGGEGSTMSSMGAAIGLSPPTPSPSPSPSQTTDEAKAAAARLILRASLSASLSSIDAVNSQGPEAWLDQKMREPNDYTAKDFFAENGLDEITADRVFLKDQSTDWMIWDQLLSGGNGVRKRVALALSEFFVVSVNELDIVWPSQAVGAFWDLLNEHAFGNFRELLEAVTLSPAMGAFLDTLGNRKEDPITGRVADENFAREIMQLFTIGLVELNIDGSPKSSILGTTETYDNSDVEGLAKVFTGFDLDASGLERRSDPGRPVDQIPEAEIVRRPMTADPTRWRYPEAVSQHSGSPKQFLGTVIPGGTGAERSLKTALDALFNHPNVGPFFGKQMIQRLVTSNPSPSYIQRVAQTFNNNGRGIRGDLAAVFKAILIDPEAQSSAGLSDQRFGKLREPAIRLIQFARTFGLGVTDGLGIDRNLSDASQYIGQVPLRAPSVFNFFRPGFVQTGTWAAANDMVAPEFQLADETSVAGYVNFMERTIEGRAFWLNDLTPDYSGILGIAGDTEALISRLDLLLTANQLRPATRDAISGAINDVVIPATGGDDLKLRRIHIAILLIMASHDYLIQR